MAGSLLIGQGVPGLVGAGPHLADFEKVEAKGLNLDEDAVSAVGRGGR